MVTTKLEPLAIREHVAGRKTRVRVAIGRGPKCARQDDSQTHQASDYRSPHKSSST